MKLQKLTIELNSWGEHKDKYTSSVQYVGGRGKVEMNLDPAISEALLSFIGPVITQFAHASALKLEQDIAQSVLEAKAAPTTIQIAATAGE